MKSHVGVLLAPLSLEFEHVLGLTSKFATNLSHQKRRYEDDTLQRGRQINEQNFVTYKQGRLASEREVLADNIRTLVRPILFTNVLYVPCACAFCPLDTYNRIVF